MYIVIMLLVIQNTEIQNLIAVYPQWRLHLPAYIIVYARATLVTVTGQV